MTKQYELVVLLAPSSTPDEVKAVTTAIRKAATARKGSVDREENWGKKFLAYPIKKQTEAMYILYDVTLDTLEAQAFERDVRLMDQVLRSLFVIKEDVK
jgi:small subunit ribosomal protein S6